MDRTFAEASPEVRRALYRTAVTQARRDVVIDLLVAATLLTASTIMWMTGWPGVVCLLLSSLGGGPAIVRGIRRWSRIRRITPTEAASLGEL